MSSPATQFACCRIVSGVCEAAGESPGCDGAGDISDVGRPARDPVAVGVAFGVTFGVTFGVAVFDEPVPEGDRLADGVAVTEARGEAVTDGLPAVGVGVALLIGVRVALNSALMPPEPPAP